MSSDMEMRAQDQMTNSFIEQGADFAKEDIIDILKRRAKAWRRNTGQLGVFAMIANELDSVAKEIQDTRPELAKDE